MTAIEALDRELARLHEEMDEFQTLNSRYDDVLAEVARVNSVLREVALKEIAIKSQEGLTTPEIKLIAAWLERASDEFSNHGCNDIPVDILGLLTIEEWNGLEKKFQKWNNTPAEFVSGRVTPNDSCWMSFLANRIKSLL